jgi:hypothetical protein
VRQRPAVAVVIGALLVLSGCAGAPEPKPTSSGAAVDNTEQSEIEGDWTLTRTVASSDDASNPAHAVAAVSTRALTFAEVTCDNGPCSGSVLSGPTVADRDETTFTSSGDVIRYEFSGFLHCRRLDTGSVLVANGFAYTAVVELTVIATSADNDKRASTLEGTMTYTDSLTAEAIEAGCTRDPAEAVTEYTLSAVRAAVEPDPAVSPAPAT